MTRPEPLPEGALLLHLGPQKTGSTAVQIAMHRSRASMAEQGVLYPGTKMRPREAGWAVLGGAAVGRPVPDIALWDELVSEVRSTTLPRVCVSNEDFARADEAAVARIAEGLVTEDTHLVFVARRLDQLLPSHWQERVKARMTLSYEEFLHHVLDTPDADWEARVTWQPHDVEAMVARWSAHVPRERITVLVSDSRRRELVPETFEGLLGLAPGTLAPPTDKANTSLTYTQAEAVRALNRLSAEQEWTEQQYRRIVQVGVVRALRRTEGDPGPRITGLPAWAHALVAERAEAQVAAIRDSGVRVIGDPGTLLVGGVTEPAELPPVLTEIPVDLAAEVALGVYEGTRSLYVREQRARKKAAAAKAAVSKPAPGLGSRIARKLRG